MATTKDLRARVMRGEIACGAMVFECFTPGIAQIMKTAGAEYVLFDMEHTGLGYETLKWLVAACRGIDVVPLARVPRSDYTYIARALDVGCHGIMVPMVESEAQARAIAEAARYPKKGRRGAAFGFAHDNFEGGDVKKKIAALDARTIVIAQIETDKGLAAVEEIAAVDGIDVLWVGHFDLTNFLGIPAEFDNAKYVSALERIVAACRKNKKGAGFLPVDPTQTRRYAEMGFNMLAAGTDQAILAAGVRAILEPAQGRKRS
jgi:2-dehydro-3-deoxyglucarate aldolase/4-hydroxy-2-oxoheptanedioate aldolase